jgi:pyruvate,water dikinase
VLAHIGNEQNDAVKELLKTVIAGAKKHGKYIGICGQGPSDYPEFAQFLVEQGIESMSLNPDTILKTLVMTAETEKRLGR